ncbi:MAG: sulfite exporter TauE/SafE family protein [Sphaerochaetaceae bacterium]
MVVTSVLLFLITLASSFLQTNLGFGFSVLAMVFLPSLFPFSTAVTLNQIIVTAADGYLAIRYWKHIDWKTMFPLLVVSLVTGIIVTLCSMSAPQGILKLILGFALVAISIFSVWFSARLKVKPSLSFGMAMGCIAGFGNGLFGMGGPPVAMYFLTGINDKLAYLATIQCYFFLSNLTTISIRLTNGSVTWAETPYILIGWLGLGIGTWLGLKTFSNLPKNLLKKLVYGFVGVSGAVIAIQEILSR